MDELREKFISELNNRIKGLEMSLNRYKNQLEVNKKSNNIKI